jgi:serine/threonine protein phosphatase PrpC
MRLESYAATDTGPVREHNEDSWGVDLDTGLFIVADGMGGHAAGEVASRIAVESIVEIMLEAEDPDETRLLVSVDDPADRIRERLRYAMNQASVRIRKAVEKEPAYSGMGTTVVVLLVEGDQAHMAHVGDSRIYLVRDGQIQRLTRDHTVVQQEIDAGRLTPELARTVPHKNILTKSVGYHGPVDPDATTRGIEPGDLFVLCTDGLTDPLADGELQKLCVSTHPEDLAQVLVEAALEGGTEDNVTVVVVNAFED